MHESPLHVSLVQCIRSHAYSRPLEEEMADEDCVCAFKSGNKLMAEQLLPRIKQPATITTMIDFSIYGVLALVSLLRPT